jgi:Mrp family chromosome partitioning ATPase
MTPGTAEALKAALRRSIPLVAILVVLGVVAYNGFKQLRGPSYEASARVLISTSDLASALTGVEQPYVDPQVLQARELALANSDELIARAQREEGLSEAEVEASLTATGADGIVNFTATSDDPEEALQLANAIAAAYIRFRADIAGETIDRAIAQIRRELATGPSSPDLQQKLSTLELMRTLNSGNATVFERAQEAQKTTPAPVRDSLLGGAIGLVIALMLSGVREIFSTRVRSDQEVEELLDLPVLASVPSFPKGAKLVTVGRYEETFADTFALLATSVMRNREASASTVLAVTSAVANEGKTLTASNLSIALARRGAKVALVDLDLRKPSVAEVFRIPSRTAGLVDVLGGKAILHEVLWSVGLDDSHEATVRTVFPAPGGTVASNGDRPAGSPSGSLVVLPAGSSSPRGPVIRSPQLAQVLEQLRARAEIVLLDTPPALQAADMAELAERIDAVLLVVRHGTVTHQSLRGLGRQTQSWPTTVIGAVMTDAQSPDHSSYYFRPA